MTLLEVLREECIAIDRGPAGKEDILRLIAQKARQCSALREIAEQTIYDALNEREAVGTTGFGNGIAIPHCALEGIERFVVGIIVVPDGAAFDALDEKPVRVFVYIVGPAQKRNEHIHLLSSISRALSDEGAIAELLSATSPAAVRENFLRHTIDTLDTGDKTERSLFHVFLQDRDLLNEVLQVFYEIDGSSVSVLEANDASYFLHSLPLFSGFLSEKKKGYHKIIIATVRRALANETLRRLGAACGDPDQRSGVLVTVQDLVYCAGNLDF
jgi:PTS system nitrogen regulatory IIA component